MMRGFLMEEEEPDMKSGRKPKFREKWVTHLKT